MTQNAWALINMAVTGMSIEHVAGERQARILAPMMAHAAAKYGYDLATAEQVYESDHPWAAEAARRAQARLAEQAAAEDKEISDGDDAPADRDASPAGGDALSQQRPVGGAAPRSTRGRRPGGRTGAGESAG